MKYRREELIANEEVVMFIEFETFDFLREVPASIIKYVFREFATMEQEGVDPNEVVRFTMKIIDAIKENEDGIQTERKAGNDDI